MRSPLKPLGLPLSAQAESVLREDLRTYNLLRAFLWLETVPRGQGRSSAALAVAAELGLHRSAFYERWRAYRRHGVQGLLRQRRSDCGTSRAYTAEELEAIRQAAPKVRNGGFSRAWRQSGCPGSCRTFMRWLKHFRKAG
jgi:hypothetical protein